jgi:hypothetical protein
MCYLLFYETQTANLWITNNVTLIYEKKIPFFIFLLVTFQVRQNILDLILMFTSELQNLRIHSLLLQLDQTHSVQIC